MHPSAVKIISVYVLICLVWGSTWLAIKLGLESLTPLVSSGMRFVLASVLILGFMKIRKVSLQRDRTSYVLYLLLALFSYSIPFGLVYWGEQYVPSGLASVLFAVFPFFVVLFSYFIIPDEEISKWKFLGLVIGFSGIVVIFSDQFGGDLTSYLMGMIAVVLSGIMQAGIAVMIKKHGRYLDPLAMNFLPMLIAGIILLVSGFLFEDISTLRFDSNAVLSVTYLALFGSVITFTSYYWLLKHINIILLSLTAFITPVIALILGWLLSGEILLVNHLAGSAMVLTGLLIANISTAGKIKNKKMTR